MTLLKCPREAERLISAVVCGLGTQALAFRGRIKDSAVAFIVAGAVLFLLFWDLDDNAHRNAADGGGIRAGAASAAEGRGVGLGGAGERDAPFFGTSSLKTHSSQTMA